MEPDTNHMHDDMQMLLAKRLAPLITTATINLENLVVRKFGKIREISWKVIKLKHRANERSLENFELKWS